MYTDIYFSPFYSHLIFYIYFANISIDFDSYICKSTTEQFYLAYYMRISFLYGHSLKIHVLFSFKQYVLALKSNRRGSKNLDPCQ